MIKYYKLFDLINRREMKKTDLLKIISAPTLAKLSKGDTIKTDIIDKICNFLEVQPGDIMEYIPEKIKFSEEDLDKICNRYEDFFDFISPQEIKDIIIKHAKSKNGIIKIDQDKVTEEIKELWTKRYKMKNFTSY